MREFDWNDVRYFLAVARTGTVSLAARRLGVDHTTVSRRIAALEQALQARLFDRRSRGFLLTPQGETFLASAEAMESTAIAAHSAIAKADLEISGAVRIGAPDGLGSHFLAPRLGRLCQQHPALEVQLLAMPRIFSLSKREADLAIGLRAPSEGRIVTRKLADYQLGLYAAESYLARAPAIRGGADLLEHTFIGYIEDLIFDPELDYIPQVGKAIRPRIQSSNLIAQLNATRAGAGVCILPCFIGDHVPGLTPILSDEVRLVRSFWLMIHDDQRHLARVRVAADFIGAEMQAARAEFMPRS